MLIICKMEFALRYIRMNVGNIASFDIFCVNFAKSTMQICIYKIFFVLLRRKRKEGHKP